MTGTPTHTLLAQFDRQEEQSVERTVSTKQKINRSATSNVMFLIDTQSDVCTVNYITNLTPVTPGGQDSFLQ